MESSIRILLADDHALLRSGVAALLNAEPDLTVVGQAATGEEAVLSADFLKPHVVVMDIDMPGIGGLEATRQIVALGHGTRILVVTQHDEASFLLPVVEAGGNGYVRKRDTEEDLVRAIRLVARGEVFLYPNATKLLLDGYRKELTREPAGPVDELSERERDVLVLTAEGYSSKAAAKRLGVSPKTVDTYRSRIVQKLGFTSRTDLVQFALRAGLLGAAAAGEER